MEFRIQIHTHARVNLPVDQCWSSGTGSAGSRTKGNAEPEQGTSWEGQQRCVVGDHNAGGSSHFLFSLGFDSDQCVM